VHSNRNSWKSRNRKLNLPPKKDHENLRALETKEFWLGGLDSNQDSQSQSLESYQLDDLPGVANKVVSVLDGLIIARFSLHFHLIVDD
jgi:hypothetical protein